GLPSPGDGRTTGQGRLLPSDSGWRQADRIVFVRAVVFVVFVFVRRIGSRFGLIQAEWQYVGQGVRPGGFLAFIVDLDKAHAFQIGQLYGPQIAAVVELAGAGVQAAFVAQQPGARAAYLHGNRIAVVFAAFE